MELPKLNLSFDHVTTGVIKADRNRVFAMAQIKGNARTPFGTWEVDPDGICFTGHYFKTESEAVRDLATLAAR